MRFSLRVSALVPCLFVLAAACGGSESPSEGDGDGDSAIIGDGDGSGGSQVGDGDGDMITPVCRAGTTMLCSGVNDDGVCSGVQACSSDGMSWGVCDCGGNAGTGGDSSSGGSDSGGSNSGGADTGGSSSGGASSGGASSGGASSGGASSGGASSGGASSGGSSSGGAGTGGSPPITNYGNAIVADQFGWVDVLSNDVGVQGYYWTDSDDLGSSVSAPDTTSEGDACFSGTAGIVNPSCEPPEGYDNCYAATWGAVLGLNLNEDESNMLSPWSATGEGIDGFQFVLTGDLAGAHARMNAVVHGSTLAYCEPLVLGLNTVRFGDFKHNCWSPEPGLVDASNLQAIQFHVATDDSSAHDFDLCVESLTAVGPPTPSTRIRPGGGWVDNTQNTVGVEGAAYSYSDGVGSTITPSGFEEYGSALCVEGQTAQVDLGCGELDCFGVYWGAVLALNLNQTGPLDEMSNPTAIAWNADGNGVSGFSFNLTNGDGANGNFGGAVVRLGVRVDGDPGIYCAYLAPGQNSIDFDEIYENCWEPDADLFNAVPDSSMLTVVEWQILGDQNDAYDYNFCVEDIFGN